MRARLSAALCGAGIESGSGHLRRAAGPKPHPTKVKFTERR